MTAQVIEIKPRSFNALIVQAKAAWDRADAKRADADEWQVRAGKILVDLKLKAKQEGVSWSTVVKKLGRSMRRAQELMQLATGDVTVEEQRERNRTSKKEARTRRKSAGRPAYSDDEPDGDIQDPDDIYAAEPGDGPEQFWPRSIENMCGTILSRRAFWDRNYPDWRKYQLPSHLKTLVREAATEMLALTAAVTKR